jgi:hypothetical protein
VEEQKEKNKKSKEDETHKEIKKKLWKEKEEDKVKAT